MDPLLQLLSLGIKFKYMNLNFLNNNPINMLLKNIQSYNASWINYANKIMNLPFGQDVVWAEFAKKYGDNIIKPEELIFRIEKAFKQKWGEEHWNEVNILVNEEIGKLNTEIVNKMKEISPKNDEFFPPTKEEIQEKDFLKIFKEKGDLSEIAKSGTPDELKNFFVRRAIIDNYWDNSTNYLYEVWEEQGLSGIQKVLVADGYDAKWAVAVDQYFVEGNFKYAWEE